MCLFTGQVAPPSSPLGLLVPISVAAVSEELFMWPMRFPDI